MWRFVAFEWQGTVWYWPSLAFGLAPACHQYTHLKLELLRPLRAAGLRLSFLIDDLFLAVQGRGKAQWLARALVELLVSLGFTLSLSKCQLVPQQRVRFLGLEVDSQQLAFVVPDDKVAALTKLVEGLEGAPQVTARDIARVAGKIMSLSPAVARAPLHSRLVGLALHGKVGWDEAVGSPGEALAQAHLFLGVLRQANGKHTWERQPTLRLQVVGDASESVFAAYLPGGQLGAQVMAVQFAPDEQGVSQRIRQCVIAQEAILGCQGSAVYQLSVTIHWYHILSPKR